MPTEKRQRKKEGHQARKAAALAAARRQQRKRRLVTAVAVAVAVLVVMALVSFLGGDDDDETHVATDGDSTSTTAAPSTTSTTLDITKPEVTVPAEPATELVVNDLVEGDGAEAKLGDTIEVHYVGVKQADGSQFDSSWDNGAPISFELAEGALIKGWTDGIPGMKVGGRRELVIPESLAYQGQEPSGTLVFVVDLIAIT